MNTNISKELFERAEKVIPGGVNSPARACRAVGSQPKFICRGQGQYVWDEDGNRMIDYIGSWGPMILGHNHLEVTKAVAKTMESGLSFGAATKSEVEMAELFCSMVPSVDMVRMVNSGTEATMSALRVARGFTGRDKIIKFEGCYHGHCDSLLVRAGSGLIADGGKPDSGGVTEGTAADTITCTYNDLLSVEKAFDANKGKIGAIIVEPVAANMGVVLPEPGFLEGLKKICEAEESLLIFDEVISGFRLAKGGAQEIFGIEPDLSVFGKIIGGGMPVGAYGGRRDVMHMVAPLGDVYQAGTLSGNPVAMAAGRAQLEYLDSNPEIYDRIDRMGNRLFNGMKTIIEARSLGYQINSIGSIGTMFFTDREVKNFKDAMSCDLKKFAEYYRAMSDGGMNIAPAQFEAIFISDKLTNDDVDETLNVVESYFRK